MTHPADHAADDQARAAAAEQGARLHDMARRVGQPVDYGKVNARIRERLRQAAATTRTVQTKACRHILAGPRPAYSTAAAPEVAVCGDCVQLLPHPGDRPACDACGTHDDTVRLLAVQAGPLMVLVAACADCRGAG